MVDLGVDAIRLQKVCGMHKEDIRNTRQRLNLIRTEYHPRETNCTEAVLRAKGR
jgi:hypothetical protein